MNILPLFSFFLITAVCWGQSVAGDVQIPASINGATINLDGELYYPSNITIERYEPQKNTARMIIRYHKRLMPRIHLSDSLTGATTIEEVYGEKGMFIPEQSRDLCFPTIITGAKRNNKIWPC